MPGQPLWNAKYAPRWQKAEKDLKASASSSSRVLAADSARVMDMSLRRSIADKGVDEARRAQALEPLATSETSGRKDFQKKYSYFPALTKPVIAAINGVRWWD